VLFTVPRRRTRPWSERAVDRLLGVSRRRRQAAYLAIGTGLAVLRPMLRRATALLVVVLAAALLAGRF
jgi:hypothetical protein